MGTVSVAYLTPDSVPDRAETKTLAKRLLAGEVIQITFTGNQTHSSRIRDFRLQGVVAFGCTIRHKDGTRTIYLWGESVDAQVRAKLAVRTRRTKQSDGSND